MSYTDEQMLMLSGIQHFRFCPRQWALIHIEQQWDENRLTIEGEILHKHVDDPSYRIKNGEEIYLRAVNVASYTLGLYGVADLIELHLAKTNENTITHPKYPGHWLPYPIEYKHGKPKANLADEVQLAAQAMCLEELYNIKLSAGAIFYATTRHRLEVEFTQELRQLVVDCASEMHRIYDTKELPPPDYEPHCKKCSLVDICMPQTRLDVNSYLQKNLYAQTT